jgi:hypothetical protein
VRLPERTIPNGPSLQKPLPQSEWRVHIRDVYPPYIDWATYEKIVAMIHDNHSEYDRNKTRGVPRPGKALLHGLVHCGECGHKMVVQYKGGTQYLRNSLRQQYRTSVCQCIRGDSVDDHVVGLFFEALAPSELDVYDRVMAALSEEQEQVHQARQQQLERLRYQARLAEASISEERSRQPARDRGTGEAMGGGLAGTETRRGGRGTRTT